MQNLFYLIPTILGVIIIFLLYKIYKKQQDLNSLQEISKILDKVDDLAKQNINLNSSLRTEILNSLTKLTTLQSKQQKQQLELFSNIQSQNFREFSEQLGKLMQVVETRLRELREDNATHLEKIRVTVDEKLTSTLNKRLAEQFQLISDRLEQVHKGLGEMQNLADGVFDLKRILSGVKNRGTWGEVQLGSILEQFLSKEQYEEKVRVKPRSQEVVEFAVKLPGKDDDNKVVYLPIDSKFPIEDYQRLLEAYQDMDKIAIEQSIKALETRIKQEAKRISEKYIAVPHTTDFAIMYLPVEGLYLEVVQRRGLIEFIQSKYRVVVAGPSTITAFLISLQMGFRTLAIQKRSSEVWKLLGVVKQEFMKFGGLLEKTSKKLQETRNVIEQAISKSRNIARKLERVESLPQSTESKTADILELPTQSIVK